MENGKVESNINVKVSKFGRLDRQGQDGERGRSDD